MGFSGLISIGERGLFVHCEGSGSPLVILEGGYGGGVNDWAAVQPVLAQQTRVCAYDRASVGSSDFPLHGPHTARGVSSDLEALLVALAIDEPVILVGFSIGGLLARYHATTHPEAVAGLVLIDPTPPVWPAMELSGLPVPVRAERLRELSGLDPDEPESLDVLKAGSEVFMLGAARVPVMMVTSGIKSKDPGMFGDERQYLMTRLQDDQARELDAIHEVAAGCTHSIPVECPEIAIDAVLRMVDQPRGSSPGDWASSGSGVNDAVRPRRQVKFSNKAQ